MIKKNILIAAIFVLCSMFVFGQTYYMDTHNGQTISTCSGTIYDSGGTGVYGNSENYTVTFCSNNGQEIHMTVMAWDIETNWDYLYFYDGPNTSSPSFGRLTGHRTVGTITDAAIQISSSNGCITLQFTSDGSNTDNGFEIIITCNTESYSGTPTNQDCLGAIPICGNSYNQPNSYVGTGQYTQEISGVSSCMKEGEKNDVWYVFNAQQSGNLQFTIQPVTTADDYDWSVFNISNAECVDILHDASLEVSCNYAMNLSGSGQTGCLNGYTLDHQWAGGTLFNAPIPVIVGETYVINVSNYSSTQSGYTIDFSLASGIMVDTSPPTLDQITNSPACGENQITFDFSEGIICSSVSTSDFTITGPGGPYTVTGVNCNSGATYSESFTLTISPALTAGGTYYLNLVGQVNDACTNPTSAHNLSFSVSGVSVSANINNHVTCYGGTNGSATATGSGGTTPYDFDWTNGSTTTTVSNLAAGTHYVTITDAGGVCTDIVSVTITQPTQVIASINPDPATTCEGTSISLTGNPNGGSGIYSTHLWTGAETVYLSSTSVVNPTFSSTAPAGSYSLTYTVIDNATCSGNDNITVVVYDAPEISAGSGYNICGTSPYTLSGASMGGGATSVTWSTSGTGSFNNSSFVNAIYTPSGGDISLGSVTLTITTNNPAGPCNTVSDNIVLTIYEPPTVNAGNNAAICEGTTYTVSGSSFGGGASSVTWTTSGDGNFNNPNIVAPIYTPGNNDISSGSVTLTITTNDPTGPCVAAFDNILLTVNSLDDAGFSYTQGTFCSTGTDPIPSINTGGGSFSAPIALVINTSSGAIDLSASTIGGPYTVTYTTNGACPNSSTFDITITSGFDAEFFYNEPYCSNEANPLPSHTTGSNGVYSSSPAGLNFINIGTGEIDLSNTAQGTYTITNYIAASGGCAEATEVDNVTIYLAPEVNAGVNDVICEGETYVLNNSTIGGSTSTLAWTSSGTGNFDSNTLLHPLYTPSAVDIALGTVMLTITSNDPVGPCGSVSNNMILTISPAPIVNANNNAIICEGDSYTLNGSYGGGASDITWTSSGTGTFDNTTLTNATYTPSAGDITSGTVTLTITTNDPGGPCNAVSDDMVITINDMPVVDAGSDDIICEGDIYTLAGSSGGGTNTIIWSGGDGVFSNSTNPTSTYTPGSGDISAGSVTLTITTDDPTGPCSSTSDNITIIINPAVVVTAGINDVICEGSTFTLNGSYSGGASSIVWTTSGDGTFDDDTDVSAIYTPGVNDIGTSVTITITSDDPSGPCPLQTDDIILTINQAATVDAGADAAICAGDDYTLVSLFGGSANSITWTSSGDGVFDDASITNATYTCGTTDITNGSVTLTITTNDPDAGGPCSAAFDDLMLSINPTPTIDSVLISDVTTCTPVQPDGEIIIYAGGGIAPLQYSINNGINYYSSNIFDSLNVGSYNIVVISSIGLCDVILDTVIIIGSTTGPVIDSVLVTDVDCYGGFGGEIEIFATGGLLYSIDNGTTIHTDSTLYTGLSAGNYTVMVADIGNCIATPWPIIITEPPLLEINFTDSVNILCYDDNNGSITVTPSGGTPGYTYLWDGGSTLTDSTATGLSAGTYNITVTDNNGCKSFGSISLTEPDSLNSTIVGINTLCYGSSDGQAIVSSSGGTGNHTYEWFDTSTNDTITGLSAGIPYYATITDVNGCFIIDSIEIGEPDSLIINSYTTDATCGGSDGMAYVIVTGGTGSGTYTYNWINSIGTQISITDTANYLSFGDYMVYVNDANGCNDSLPVQIYNLGGGSITVDYINNVLCFGDNDGEIVVTLTNGTPDFTFYWSTNDTVITSSYTDTLSYLAAGNYSVTIIDANDCQADTNITITGPTSALVTTYTVINVSCYGDSTGQIHMNTTGGTVPYTYIWAPNGYTEGDSIYSGLPAGTYSVTITDANACSIIEPKIDVGEPIELTMTLNEFSPACYGDTTGKVEVIVYGGTIPYNYAWYNANWSNVITDSVLTNVVAGSYSLTVTDAHSCTVLDIATIYDPTEITVVIEDTIEADYTGSIELTVSGGNPPYIFVWSNESTDKDILGLESGIYIVTITDGNLCTIIDSVEIIIPLIIPTLFTPNKDGFNDEWRITNIDEYEDISIEIFNRWGDLVFTFSGNGEKYSNSPWDGKYGGADIPMGSYVYIIDLKNETDPYNGVISVKR